MLRQNFGGPTAARKLAAGDGGGTETARLGVAGELEWRQACGHPRPTRGNRADVGVHRTLEFPIAGTVCATRDLKCKFQHGDLMSHFKSLRDLFLVFWTVMIMTCFAACAQDSWQTILN